MAYSRVTYIGDGSNTIFTVPFEYLKKSFVKVVVAEEPVPSENFEWLTSTSIKLAVAPAAGSTIYIYRDTEKEAPVTGYRDGSVLTGSDLDNQTRQLLHIAQETQDVADEQMRLDSHDLKYDAQGRVIKNVGDAVADTDAVNFRTWKQVIQPALDDALAQATVKANQAEASAVGANSSALLASGQATISGQHARESEASAAASAQSAVEAKVAAEVAKETLPENWIPRVQSLEAFSVAENGRMDAVETKNTQQDARLDAVELKNTQQDLRLDTAEAKLSTTKKIVVLTSSGAFHAPAAGDYRVTCIGGGGAGGAGGASSINGGGQGGTTTFKDVSAAGGSGGGNGRPAIGGYGGATSGGSGQAGKVVVGYVHLEHNEIVDYIVGAGGLAGASTTGSGAGPEGGPAANCNWIVGGGARGASHGIVGRGSHDNQGANFGGGGDSNGTGYGGGGPGGNAIQSVTPVQLTGPDGAGSTNTSTGAGGNGGNGAIILEFSA